MIDYTVVLVELETERDRIQAVIDAVTALWKGAGATAAKVARPAKVRRKVKRRKKITRDLGGVSAREITAPIAGEDGPGKGRKRCAHCGQHSGTRAKWCEKCMEPFP